MQLAWIRVGWCGPRMHQDDSLKASAADIFVYKGTAAIRGSLDVANTFPPSVRLYIVVDFETGAARGILYHNRGGKVQFVNNSPFKVTRVTLPNTKTGTVIAYGGTSETSVNEFSLSAVVLQGTDVARFCSGRAIRLPNPPFGNVSWFGNNRS